MQYEEFRHSFYESVSILYKESENAVFIMDESFTIHWSNEKAQKEFPLLSKIGDNFNKLISSGGKKEIFDYLSNQKETIVLDSDETYLETTVELTPIFHDGKLLAIIGIIDQFKREKHMKWISQFASSMAYSIREPIANDFPSLLYLSKILDGEQFPEEHAILNNIVQNHLRSLKSIDSLYKYVGLYYGNISLHKRPIEFTTYVIEIINSVKQFSDSKNIELTKKIPNHSIILNIDENMMMIAILSIYSNAIEHTDEGGKISLNMEIVGDRVILTISDNGEGIKEEYLENLLVSPLHMIDKNGFTPGIPMGFKLAKIIVAKHGGTMFVRSEEGIGTSTTLSLPLSKSKNPMKLKQNSADYISNKLSPLYIYLSNISVEQF